MPTCSQVSKPFTSRNKRGPMNVTAGGCVRTTPARKRLFPARLPECCLLALSCLLVLGLPFGAAPATANELSLTLQTRDPATGEVVRTVERVDPRKIGVVAVDIWNYHWCKTATMRVDAFVPRIDRALEALRQLGATVMLCPSDIVDNYAGLPQRQQVLALPLVEVPRTVDVQCPPVPDAGGCACGRERCRGNFGWDGMHPALRIGPQDWMPDTQAEVYTICRQRGLTHLLYVGFHTQVCLLGKPMGLRAMKSTGLRCMLARDMTDAHPGYDPSRGFTPDLNTEQVVEHFEKHLAPTIHLQQELEKMNRWDPATPVDPVRIAPWGTRMRPHLFEEPITVTLTAPLQPDAAIHYTLDGSAPTVDSPRYEQPLVITDSTQVRAMAFLGKQPAGVASEGTFARLVAMPPQPDVYLGDLKPSRSVGFGHTYGGEVRYSGHTRPPQVDRANHGEPLKVGGQVYERGLGVHATTDVAYELRPEFTRFVGLAGADDHIGSLNFGSNLARFPSVVFRIFIDGRLVAESPVMRILSTAWRFDVPIPPGSRNIHLVATDAEDGSREDYANWVDAGFLVRKSSP